VTVTDVYGPAVERAVAELGAECVKPGDEFDLECDVFSPCALGAQINATTIPRLRCEMVVGSANNQLLEPADDERLAERGILYAPDFVVNAGGVINIFEELQEQGYSPERALRSVDGLYDRTLAVLEKARDEKVLPDVAAQRLANERIAAVSDLKRRL
jgi:leucine dehydrogenase